MSVAETFCLWSRYQMLVIDRLFLLFTQKEILPILAKNKAIFILLDLNTMEGWAKIASSTYLHELQKKMSLTTSSFWKLLFGLKMCYSIQDTWSQYTNTHATSFLNKYFMDDFLMGLTKEIGDKNFIKIILKYINF